MLKRCLKLQNALRKLLICFSNEAKKLVSVPESAGALHFAWQIVFSDYTAWVDAQYAVYTAIAKGKPPFAEHVQTLFRQQEESHQKALQEEKKLLKLLKASGLTPSDIQGLTDRAFAAIEAERW